MTERDQDRRPLTDEEKRRAGNGDIPDEELNYKELRFRNYVRRLTDWTPDNITIVRDGKPISGPGLERKIELSRMAAEQVDDGDDDGKRIRSDGTIVP